MGLFVIAGTFLCGKRGTFLSWPRVCGRWPMGA